MTGEVVGRGSFTHARKGGGSGSIFGNVPGHIVTCGWQEAGVKPIEEESIENVENDVHSGDVGVWASRKGAIEMN